jgi:hypothetical protein
MIMVPRHTAAVKRWYWGQLRLGAPHPEEPVARRDGRVELVEAADDLDEDVAPLHDGEVGLCVRGARGVLRRLLERTDKVRALEEEDGLGDVERERKLLEGAGELAAHGRRVARRALGVGIHRGQGEEGGAAAHPEGDVALERAQPVVQRLDGGVGGRAHVHRLVEDRA